MNFKSINYILLSTISVFIMSGCGNVETSDNNLNEPTAESSHEQVAMLIQESEIKSTSSLTQKQTISPSISLNKTMVETLKEDAEDGTTSKWAIYDKSPSGATINNVYDEERQSKVIQFQGNGLNNGFVIGSWTATGAWRNAEKTIQWSMKTSEEYMLYLRVTTRRGYRYLYYTPSDYNWGVSSYDNPHYIHHGLGSNSNDGTWQTFTRDLSADLKEFEHNPNIIDNSILSVDGFFVRGSGMVDDIKLLTEEKDLVTTVQQALVEGIKYTGTITAEDIISLNETSSLVKVSYGYILVNVSNPNVAIMYALFNPMTDYNTLYDHPNSLIVSKDKTKVFMVMNHRTNPNDKRIYIMHNLLSKAIFALEENISGTPTIELLEDDKVRYTVGDTTKIYDINNASVTNILPEITEPTITLTDPMIINDTTVLVKSQNGFELYDVSTPQTPTLLSSYDVSDTKTCKDILISEDKQHLFVHAWILPSSNLNCDYSGFIGNLPSQVINISDLSNPTLQVTGTTLKANYMGNVHPRWEHLGNNTYLVSVENELVLYDLKDYKKIGSFTNCILKKKISLDKTKLYVLSSPRYRSGCAKPDSLFVLDFSDLSTLQEYTKIHYTGTKYLNLTDFELLENETKVKFISDKNEINIIDLQ